jgi:excisionase family DNA binding protein
MPERPDAAGHHRPPDRLITPKDAADRLVASPSTVLLWLKTGQLKGIKAGKLWHIPERAIDEFLKEPEPPRKAAPVEEPVRAKEPMPREASGRVKSWSRRRRKNMLLDPNDFEQVWKHIHACCAARQTIGRER